MEDLSMSIIGSADGPVQTFLAGILDTQILVLTIIVGLVLCVFGLKLMRILSGAAGMIIGVALGAMIVTLANLTGTITMIVIFGCGIVLALLAVFLRKVGAFLSVLCYAFGSLMIVFSPSSILVLVIFGVISLALAIAAAIYVEPLVVVVSSISGGMMAGTAITLLLGLDEKVWIGYIIAIVLAVLGILIQLLMQSGKIKKKDKIHSQKVKEEDSMESEVEKARMILDDGDADTEEDDLYIMDDQL